MMRQSGAATLATEEPDAFIAHVRVCGGAGWVTTGSTRKRRGVLLEAIRQEQRYTAGRQHLYDLMHHPLGHCQGTGARVND